ncbi:MAG: disulfide bond formation protein B [Actinomycetota bacterium]
MGIETATLFFALLSLATALAVVAVAVLALVDRPRLDTIRDVALEAATAVAVVSTLGSLYLSEIALFEPCRLCWIQRGFMYPAAVVLVVALVTRRRALTWVAAALSALGLPIAVFHRVEQAVGELSGVCDAATPCAARWINHLGFITIPTMAAIGFAAVLVFTTLTLTDSRSSS